MKDREPSEGEPISARSEALPPDIPGAVHAEVVSGRPGTVAPDTPSRPAGGERGGGEAAGPSGDAVLRARLDEVERENRELWSLLREERRARLQEVERLTRMVELACRRHGD
jgi:hypothetical protein